MKLKKKPPVRPASWRLLNRDGTFNVARSGTRRIRATDLYHSLLSVGWFRFNLLVILVYFSVNALFALGYLLCGPGALEGSKHADFSGRFSDAFFFSVQTLATIGYGKITPSGILPNLLVTFEALVGLMGLALGTGLLFARFSKPTARVVFSQTAVITPHEGIDSLIFRMSNARLNQIVDARVSVVLSISEKTKEGQQYRTFYDLALERERSPIFALTWTVIHPIDAKSPLYKKDQKSLIEADAEIIVSLTGIDDTFSQTIHARFSYTPTEIVWGKDFRDMLNRTPDGKIQVNLKKIHELADS